VVDVNCGLYEMSKNNSTNAVRGLNPVQESSQTKPKWRVWSGPVLTLVLS